MIPRLWHFKGEKKQNIDIMSKKVYNVINVVRKTQK